MKQVLFVLPLLIIVSCDKVNQLAQSHTVRLDELIGIWHQAQPHKYNLTNLETGVTTEIFYQETFTLSSDNTFSISDPAYFFRTENSGDYLWDEALQEIRFTTKPVTIEIGGNPTVIDSKVSKWKWKIISLENDSLYVDVFNYVESKNSFIHVSEQLYMKR